MNLKACTTGQIDASHLELLPHNEAYRCVLDEVSELAKMPVKTATA